MFGNAQEAGIISMAISQVFQCIMEAPNREFVLSISYMEIYNEVIKDLLCPENDNLQIRESTDRGIFVGKLTDEVVGCAADVNRLLMVGEGNRHTGETNMNEKSSRSHTVFRMSIESREKDLQNTHQFTGSVKVSQLTLVDLAGSERVSNTFAHGIRLKEGGMINKR